MRKKAIVKAILFILVCTGILGGGLYVYRSVMGVLNEPKVLKEIIARLEADTRIAEVLVTEVKADEESGKTLTTIKFLEYDADGIPLTPQYFTFSGNVIQFQSLVVRFDDLYVRNGEGLKGKSAYLFWKVFMLDGAHTEEYTITRINEIPEGYKVEGLTSPIENVVWEKFWEYALDPTKAKQVGIKNVQIEAPGTLFVPGTLYTLKIEHDGGMRIDAAPLSPILRGERIP